MKLAALEAKQCVHVSAGHSHSAALVGAENELYLWGSNHEGQLGNDETEDSNDPTSHELGEDEELAQVK